MWAAVDSGAKAYGTAEGRNHVPLHVLTFSLGIASCRNSGTPPSLPWNMANEFNILSAAGRRTGLGSKI